MYNNTSTSVTTTNATTIHPTWSEIEALINSVPSHEHELNDKDRLRMARKILTPDYGEILRGC